jgi:hypothetical protein
MSSTSCGTLTCGRHLVDRCANFAFEGSVMHDLRARLQNDPIFAKRMPAIVRAVGTMLRYTGFLHALTYVPTRFQTPMEVIIKKS